MSDTQAKIDARRAEAQKIKERNQRRAARKVKLSNSAKSKLNKVLTAVVAVVLALALVLAVFPFMKHIVPAVKVGKSVYTTSDFTYAYNSDVNNFYSNYYQYLSYFGLETGTPLNKQAYSDDMTWADYFVKDAVEALKQMSVLAQEAKANGYKLSDEELAAVDSMMEDLRKNANNYGYGDNVDRFVKAMYGSGVSKGTVKKMLKLQMLAESYMNHVQDGYNFTVADFEEKYKENENEYRTVNIRYQRFIPSYSSSSTETEKYQAIVDNSTLAHSFYNAVTDETSFSEHALELAKKQASDPSTVTTESTLHEGTAYSTLQSISEELADWAFGADTKVGEKYIYYNDSTYAYTVAMLISSPARDEYNTVDVRHILIAVDSDAEDKDVEIPVPDAEAKEGTRGNALYQIQEIEKAWKEAGATEEAFAKLADEKSADGAEGGLYTKITKGYMVSEFNDWIFDEARKPGDCEIVYSSDYGYHLIYFVGENLPAWQAAVEKDMIEEAYNTYVEEATAKYPVKEFRFGEWYRSEIWK